MENREPDVEDHTIFTEGDDLFEAMNADIWKARRRILLEMYIFKEDHVGSQIIHALLQAAERGVEVKLSLDALGSGRVFSQSAVTVLRNAGVSVCWAQTWNWRQPWRYQRRDHSKLLVIDDGITYVGGFNIGEESSLRYSGKGRWRDLHIRLSGPIARRAARLFESRHAFGRDRVEDEWFGAYLLMSNYGIRCRYRLRCLLNGRLRHAVSRIWLTTPYFVPDSGTQRRLISAAQRGVDVRLLVPAKSDIRITQWAARMLYENLLRAGVKIYEYSPQFLHAKTILVDSNWSSIGTANFDYRSFFLNYDLALICSSEIICDELANMFEINISDSRIVEERVWRSRPYTSRIQEFLGWVVRRFL